MLPKITGKRLVKQIMICPHNRILSEEQGKLFKLIGKNFPDKVLSEKKPGTEPKCAEYDTLYIGKHISMCL